MKDKNTRYYLIRKRTVGKWESGNYYFFEDGAWKHDLKSEILGLLIGFDPSEPPGSPYAIGCLDVLDKIENITREKALQLTGGRG